MERSGSWIKVALFLIGIAMLAGVVTVLLDPGLGKPTEARRSKHPSGFSIAVPLGWGASFFGRPDEDQLLRATPERATGRSTIIAVSRLRQAPEIDQTTPAQFQGQPAYLTSRQTRNAWYGLMYFQRDGSWYEITVSNPIPLDLPKSPLMPFIESFRVEGATSAPARPVPAATSPAP